MFDVTNLDNYDAILGTPFLFQHKIVIGMNPSCVVVGSDSPTELEGPDVMTIGSAAADLLNNRLTELRVELKKDAEDLCTDPSKTTLPPFRAVNHTIPLIEECKIYKFRRSKCPKAFKEQWQAKRTLTYQLGDGVWQPAIM